MGAAFGRAHHSDNKTAWYQYDDLGRPTETVYKWLDQVGGTPGIYTKNTYMSCCGLLESQRDPDGDRTYYAYDPMKRVSKVWSDVQTREWDAAGSMPDAVQHKSRPSRIGFHLGAGAFTIPNYIQHSL